MYISGKVTPLFILIFGIPFKHTFSSTDQPIPTPAESVSIPLEDEKYMNPPPQRDLPDNETCGTVKIQYVFGVDKHSIIGLRNQEELFAVIKSVNIWTRELISHTASSFVAISTELEGQGCEFELCGSYVFKRSYGIRTCVSSTVFVESIYPVEILHGTTVDSITCLCQDLISESDRPFQRVLLPNETCGTARFEYRYEETKAARSQIDLRSREELFTLIKSRNHTTREWMADNLVTFNAKPNIERKGENCELTVCGQRSGLSIPENPTCATMDYKNQSYGSRPEIFAKAESITCLCTKIECAKFDCGNVVLEPEEFARLYHEPFCRECYTESNPISIPKNMKETDPNYQFNDYNPLGIKSITSAVVNKDCDLWIMTTGTLYESVPAQVHSGPKLVNIFTGLDAAKIVWFKCWKLTDKQNPDSDAPGAIAAIAATVFLLIFLLVVGITLAWRKSTKVEKHLKQQHEEKFSASELKEFFKGKAAAEPSAILKKTDAVSIRADNYKTLKEVARGGGSTTLVDSDKRQANVPAHSKTTIDVALSQPYQYKWEISKKRIEKTTKRLGDGCSGEVFGGRLQREDTKHWIEIAIKIARSRNDIRSVLTEIKLFNYMGNHPNIVSMLGANVTDLRDGKSSGVWILLELCENGSLKKFLHDHRAILDVAMTNTQHRNANTGADDVLKDKNCLKWSYEIASGMEFLEEMKIVHIDLAARNVLLNADLVAKIGDFGLSRKLYTNMEYEKYVDPVTGSPNDALPFRWMAPESLQKLVFTSKTDVWSFGITVWEIFTHGQEPFPQFSDYDEFSQCIKTNMRLPALSEDDENKIEVYSQLSKCWDVDPNSRPTFTDLKIFFETKVQKITD